MSLTNEELLEALRSGAGIPVPFFDGEEVELFFEDEGELLHFADAIRAFLTLTEADRLAATRHVFAYFKDFSEHVGLEEFEPDLQQLAPGSEDIWRFVYPSSIGGMESWDVGDKDRQRKYIVLEGDCAWEEEHGLLMSWRDGTELVKVSDYDGHPTNGHAHGDVTKDAFVYHGLDADMSTKASG